MLTGMAPTSGFSPTTISAPQWVHDAADMSGPKSFQATFLANQTASQMTWAERVLLYTSVFSCRPKRCLEIGTFRGGSALIIVAALNDMGSGRLVCVDPYPRMAPETWAQLVHRTTLIQGTSPGALAEAAAAAGGKFDWALIDGGHDYDSLVRDLEGTMPVLEDEAYILFHDAHYKDVEAGLNDMYAKHPELIDMGMMAKPRVPDGDNPGIYWGGIRMARFLRKR